MTGKLPARREGRNTTGKDSLCKGSKNMKESSVFGKFSDAEMVAQLKALALDPCNSEYSKSKIRPLWNQTIRLRKAMAMADTEIPRVRLQLCYCFKNNSLIPFCFLVVRIYRIGKLVDSYSCLNPKRVWFFSGEGATREPNSVTGQKSHPFLISQALLT